jgi:L,D-transpeptidase YcbB
MRRLALLPLLFLCTFLIGAANTPLDRTAEALRENVDLLRTHGRIVVAGEEIVSHVALPLLYDEYRFQPLWRDPSRVDALLEALQGLAADGLEPADYHYRALSTLWPRIRGGASPFELAESRPARQRRLRARALSPLPRQGGSGVVEATWNFDPREVKDRRGARVPEGRDRRGRIAKARSTTCGPSHSMYEDGRRALAEYRRSRCAAAGSRCGGPQLEPGADRRPRTRAAASADGTGDYAGPQDESTVYDADLERACGSSRHRHLLSPDGAVGPATLRELNVPVSARIDQIRVNLERGPLGAARDRRRRPGDGRHRRLRRALHARRQDDLESRAMVGQPYRQTPIFKSRDRVRRAQPDLDGAARHPRRRTSCPACAATASYLAGRGSKVYRPPERPVDPASIDFSRYTGNSFPYFLRQAAGDDNALGRVKIMFPNPHLVYLHDTPSALAVRGRTSGRSAPAASACEKPVRAGRDAARRPERWTARRDARPWRPARRAPSRCRSPSRAADLLDGGPGRRGPRRVQARRVRPRPRAAEGARRTVRVRDARQGLRLLAIGTAGGFVP